jgi:hypothetical protein
MTDQVVSVSGNAAEAPSFDYGAAAELFSAGGRKFGPQRHMGYRRFASAAEAIRFAMEELPAARLPGAYLQVDEARYGGADIRRLYESTGYSRRARPRRGACGKSIGSG